MTELLTAAQMRSIETAAMSSGAVTGLELMERAGQGVVDAIFEEWPDLGAEAAEEGDAAPRPAASPQGILSKRKAVVLCGPGNNGGDGFVLARLLFERGWAIEVFLYGDPEKLPPDARMNYERWCTLGDCAEWRDLDAETAEADLFVDAVFGTGLTRPIPGPVSRQLLLAHKRNTKVIAIDMPSGLCADSGKMLESERGAFCDLAVSFHTAKVGHVLAQAPERIKKVVVKDIGLPHAFDARHVHTVEDDWVDAERGPDLSKTIYGHKFSYGHVLVFSGGAGKTGAARLAARGALRMGAGLVTLAVPGAAQMEVASQITALMLRRIDDGEAVTELLRDPRFNALCLGPGLGMDRARALVPAALAAKRATVLDADALSAFAEAPDALFAQLHEDCVLTPHGGEFARLFPDLASRLTATPETGPAYSKVEATRAAAARAGCTVLFKGPDTVIADASGRCSVTAALYDRAAPWLATAGSGDVLAGFITGLLARGASPMQAAEAAAWLHVECARSFGPGLIAEDLPEQLPRVFRTLGL